MYFFGPKNETSIYFEKYDNQYFWDFFLYTLKSVLQAI